jgi:hypothetical protein
MNDMSTRKCEDIPQPKRWLSLDEMAEQTGLSAETIRLYTRMPDELPAFHIGKRLLVTVENFDRWCAAREAQVPARRGRPPTALARSTKKTA